MKRTIIALAAGGLLLTGCTGTEQPDTFESRVIVAGNSDRIYDDECTFAEGTVGVDTAVIVRGADDRILGKQNLNVINITSYSAGAAGGPCSFDASFELEPGDAAYQVAIDGLDDLAPEIFTESEMRDAPSLSLQSSITAGLSGLSGR